MMLGIARGMVPSSELISRQKSWVPAADVLSIEMV